MRCWAAGVVIVAVAGGESAGQPATAAESKDLFGFDKKPPAAAARTGCEDTAELGCAFVADSLAARGGPFALTTILTPARWRDLAVADSDHDAIVTFALGATRDDSGVFFGGASGLENRWLVEGAPSESLYTGGVETRVPLAFIDRITVTAGGFAAADRASTGGAVDVGLIRGGTTHELAAEVWASGATSREPLPAIPQYFDPIVGTVGDPRAVSLAVVARGPIARIAGATTWYAAGIRPVLRGDGFTRDARRLVDLDQDGNPDLDADEVPISEEIDHDPWTEYAYQVPMLARVGLARGHHAVELTGLVTAYRDTRWNALATESAAGVRRDGAVIDGIATWRGTWARTRARVIASWHRNQFRESPRRGDSATPQFGTAYIPPASDLPAEPGLGARCDDLATDDPYPLIPNCPLRRGFFAQGGAGLLFAQTADRPALSADVAHRLGGHTVAAGVSGEDGRLVDRRRYTGGEQAFQLFDGFVLTNRFVEIGDGADTVPCSDDPAVTDRCRTVDESSITYRTRQLAAFVADDWRPRRDFAFTGGVRWESMELGDAFTFRDQIAPRVGFAWDALGGGRSRVFAGFGRSYAVMPARTGELTVGYHPTVGDADLGGVHTLQFADGRPYIAIDPQLAPVVVEELTAGIELALRDALRITTWGQVRWQRRGIEDAPDPDGGLMLTNPVDPAATRRSMMLALELATAPGRFGLRAQYQYARSFGATTGPYDPFSNQQPYLSSDFDHPAAAANLRGRLPSDLRHRAAIEGVGRLTVGPVPVVIAVRAQLTSGRPTNALVASPERTMLIARGSAGRLGLVTTTSLHLAADLGHGLELVAEVFNLFDRQRATAVDETYTDDDTVVPIIGGGSEDLLYLKNSFGSPVAPLPTYGRATARQAPLSAAIGVRARF